MVVTLNELKHPNNNVGVLFRRTLHTDVRWACTFALLSIDGPVCVIFAKILGF
jgi:hypothetical protein